MRLLNIKSLRLESFDVENAPDYAIASHRWADSEATFEDVQQRKNRNTAGFQKVKKFCYMVRQWSDLEWIWIDSCCINKADPTELATAIRSMFRWYRSAEICFVYMADVVAEGSERQDLKERFSRSEWFVRGWTLQELLAPPMVAFVTEDLEYMGYKGTADIVPTDCLNSMITDITGIPEDVLECWDNSQRYSDNTIWTWTENRESETKWKEDKYYCLEGIFGIQMPYLYGETKEKARKRLRDEIRKDRLERLQRQKKEKTGNRDSIITTLSVRTSHLFTQPPRKPVVVELVGSEREDSIRRIIAEDAGRKERRYRASNTDGARQSSAKTADAEYYTGRGRTRDRVWDAADTRRSSAGTMESDDSAVDIHGASSAGTLDSESSEESDEASTVFDGETKGWLPERCQDWDTDDRRRPSTEDRYFSTRGRQEHRPAGTKRRPKSERRQSPVFQSPEMKGWNDRFPSIEDRRSSSLEAQHSPAFPQGRNSNAPFQPPRTNNSANRASSGDWTATASDTDDWNDFEDSDDSYDSDDSEMKFSFFHRLKGKVLFRKKKRGSWAVHSGRSYV